MSVTRALLATVLLSAFFVHSASAQPTLTALTNADVIRFVAMGMADQVVNTLIGEAKVTQFDLSPSAVSNLAAHGVSPVVIAAMRQPSAPSASGASSLSSATAQQLPQLKTILDWTLSGMQPLTAESLQRALIEGEKSGTHMNDSMGMLIEKMAARRDVSGPDDLPRAALLMSGHPPFSFVLWSPYSEATLLSATAKRRFEPRPVPSIDDLNRPQILVTVSPSADFTKAAAIENVVIKRGPAVLHPIKSDVKPIEIRNGLGAIRKVSEGDFTFPFSAFDQSMAITVVLIGDKGNFEWQITREELAGMK